MVSISCPCIKKHTPLIVRRCVNIFQSGMKRHVWFFFFLRCWSSLSLKQIPEIKANLFMFSHFHLCTEDESALVYSESLVSHLPSCLVKPIII